jgi:transcriptional regulator of acetoin/glycerol metabolism
LTLTDHGGVIDDEAVADILPSPCEAADPRGAATGIGETERNLHELQRARVLAAYAETGNNISKTARRLGVSRNMIYRALQGHAR